MGGRKGLAAVEKAVESSKATGTYSRLNFLGLGEGESIIVRFLTDIDDVVTVKMYELIYGPNGKPSGFVYAPDWFEEEPDKAVDWVKKFGGKQREKGTTGDPVDPKLTERTIAIAVEREEVPVDGEDGKRRKKTQDKFVKVPTKNDGELEGRNFILVKQAHKNFWVHLVQYFHEFGTLCDRDYKITRTGKGFDTSYSIIPKTPDEDWDESGSSLVALKERYGYGTGKDIDGNDLAADSEERFFYCPQTLDDWCDYWASEEAAKKFLTGDPKEEAVARRENNSGGGYTSDDPDEAQVAPSSSGSSASKLRERLQRHQ